MGEHKPDCAECGGATDEGFIIDKTQSAFMAERWIKGEPPESNRGPNFAGVEYSAKGRECRLVRTFRCVDCGFLKSYAIEEVEPPRYFSA